MFTTAAQSSLLFAEVMTLGVLSRMALAKQHLLRRLSALAYAPLREQQGLGRVGGGGGGGGGGS